MKFIPTTQMRYASALRCVLQKRISRRGISREVAEKLIKIYVFEGTLFKCGYIRTFDVSSVSDVILGALFITAAAKGISLSSKIGSGGNIRLNIKLYELLLSSIVLSVKPNSRVNIRISTAPKSLMITFSGDMINAFYKKIAALMGGVCIKLVNSRENTVFIPFEKGEERAEKYKSEIALISDAFSAVNLFSALI